MVLIAVVSIILDDRGRLLLGLEIGGPRGIDPLGRREFENVLSDAALLVLQLEAVVGDVIFGQGRAFGDESHRLALQALQLVGSLMVAGGLGLVDLVEDVGFELKDAPSGDGGKTWKT